MRPTIPIGSLLLAFTLPAAAQQSPHFQLREHTINSGGRPLDGAYARSAQFAVTLDAIGESVATPTLTSAGGSFSVTSNWPGAYLPPSEVQGMVFSDQQTMRWTAHPAAGTYQLYRNPITVPFDALFGACAQPGIAAPTAVDAGTPLAGEAWFYLVTVRNLLGEEGTKGFTSGGVERNLSQPCP